LFFNTSDRPDHPQIYPYKKACNYFERFKIPYAVVVLHEGPLKELLPNLDPNTFQSTIYAKNGLPKLAENIAEGYVIKPDAPITG
jgi:hypothetical protein